MTGKLGRYACLQYTSLNRGMVRKDEYLGKYGESG